MKRTLLNLGISPALKGFDYIVDCITAIKEHGRVKTMWLYTNVAKKHNTTAFRVKRCIRHAIEVAFDRGDLKLLEKVFGYSYNADRGRPTNSEFLYTLAMHDDEKSVENG